MHEHGKVIFVEIPREGASERTGEVWKSQDFVIEIDGRYTRKVKFNLYGAERVDKAQLQVGMIVDVDAEVEAHEYQGKWYNEIRAWRISCNGVNLIG